MSAKECFVRDVVVHGMSVTEAASANDVSRSCGYKWIAKYQRFGLPGLEEQSRAPHSHPNRTSDEIVERLLALKRKHPHFGPQKLAAMLELSAGHHVMAASTAGEVLSRHGMVTRRKRRHRSAGAISHPSFEMGASGHSMTADFKGEFRTQDRHLCYPLTIADPVSRYVFAIRGLRSTQTDPVQNWFERVFREHGVPYQLITDNGTPFCSRRSLGGLTRLSRWWIELGITPVRILPGRPQQNGIHERMHKSLSEWLKANTRRDLRSQQISLNRFRKEFNEIRPHESLGQKPPITSLGMYRPFPKKRPKPEYDSNMLVRTVRSNGYIKWNGIQIFLSEVLTDAAVGLRQVDNRIWTIHFGHVQLGFLDEVDQRVYNRLPEQPKAKDSAKEETKPADD